MAALRGRGRKFKSEINVVPYIDVMLVLLVIFMVAAPLSTPGVIDLPTAAKSNLPPSHYVQITLKPDSAATIGMGGPAAGQSQPVEVPNPAALLHRLRELHAANPELPVMIAADGKIPYEEVVRTISDAKRIGIHRVGLATRE